MNTFIYFMLLASATGIVSHSQNKDIFILAGQSNMVGRGGVVNGTWDGIVPPESHPCPSILRLSAELKWVQAQDPLHKDIDVRNTCGVGPGMPFVNSVLAKHSNIRVVGLVPCAVGGASMSLWARGTTLYNQTLRRAAAAVQGGGIIRGMLWYQGESETLNETNANLYKKELEKFFKDLRTDLCVPKLPIIQVALASGGPYVEIVREVQLGTKLPNVETVDANGLQLEPDQLHLTTPSQVRLGRMMADAFLRMYAPKQ